MIMVKMSNAVKGFTLMELMMTLSIAAILLTVAVPSYNTFTQNSKITKQVNLLAVAVNTARGEAAKRGVTVVLCQSDAPTVADPECGDTSPAGTWSNGYIVFVDTDGDGIHDTGGTPKTEPVIGAFQSEANVAIKTTAGSNLVINPDGTITVAGGVEFAVCDSRGIPKGKQLSVAGTGRPSTADATSCG